MNPWLGPEEADHGTAFGGVRIAIVSRHSQKTTISRLRLGAWGQTWFLLYIGRGRPSDSRQSDGTGTAVCSNGSEQNKSTAIALAPQEESNFRQRRQAADCFVVFYKCGGSAPGLWSLSIRSHQHDCAVATASGRRQCVLQERGDEAACFEGCADFADRPGVTGWRKLDDGTTARLRRFSRRRNLLN